MNYKDLDDALQFFNSYDGSIVIQHSHYEDRFTLINYVMTKMSAEGHKPILHKVISAVVCGLHMIIFDTPHKDDENISDIRENPIQSRFFVRRDGEDFLAEGPFNPNYYSGIGLEEVDK